MAKEKEAKPQQKQAPKKEAPRKDAPKAESPKQEKHAAPAAPPPPARLREFYRERVVPDLMQKFGYKTVMQVPRIAKITINMGVGEAVGDKKVLDNAVGDMAKIAGQ